MGWDGIGWDGSGWDRTGWDVRPWSVHLPAFLTAALAHELAHSDGSSLSMH